MIATIPLEATEQMLRAANPAFRGDDEMLRRAWSAMAAEALRQYQPVRYLTMGEGRYEDLRARLDRAGLEVLKRGFDWVESPYEFTTIAGEQMLQAYGGPLVPGALPLAGWRLIRQDIWQAAGQPGL